MDNERLSYLLCGLNRGLWKRRTVLKNKLSTLVQYLTIACACIGRVQVSLLKAIGLVSDTYALQSRLQTAKVADNYLVRPVFHVFQLCFMVSMWIWTQCFSAILDHFFIKKKQPTKKPQTACTSSSPLSYRQDVHTLDKSEFILPIKEAWFWHCN